MLSNSCEYALRALIYITANGSEDSKITIGEISKALEMPSHYLGKILQDLVRREVLISLKGAQRGGVHP